MSKEEQELFHSRWENGYDIKTDHPYNKWLFLNKEGKTVAEDKVKSSDDTAPTLKVPSALLHIIPELPSNMKKNSEKKFRSACVLTSEAALHQMEEKDRLKGEEEARKEKREHGRGLRNRHPLKEKLKRNKKIRNEHAKRKYNRRIVE